MVEDKIEILQQLKNKLQNLSPELDLAKQKALQENNWFTAQYTQLAIDNICNYLLDEAQLRLWIANYPNILNGKIDKNNILGIIMAGNIPLVGFHDFLCGYISGVNLYLKLSSKDKSLWYYIFGILNELDPTFNEKVKIGEQLKGCDAYIATGSNNAAQTFDYYFSKYPHIIRKNRTSIGLLTGNETDDDLKGLSDDVCLYYGLGCRNITKIWVPDGYDFTRLLPFFNAYEAHFDFQKYRNNYDYQLAIFLLNKKLYMTNGSVLLVENEANFAPVSVLNYQSDNNPLSLINNLNEDNQVQAIALGKANLEQLNLPDNSKVKAFGALQKPTLMDYADGVDVLEFIQKL